jgi:adenine phosphoribosyltransferase
MDPRDKRIELIKKTIRDIPDFPKPGIIFKDITPLLASPEAFKAAIDLLLEQHRPEKVEGVLAIESRGFVFGAPLALHLSVPLLIVRKPGKLPYKVTSIDYSLEYGTGKLEMHKDSVRPGQRILVVDDLLATGGTAAAATRLVEKEGGAVIGCSFIIELAFLKGREKISPTSVHSLVSF